MKNQTANFTSATEATLSIRVYRGRQDWVVKVRQRTPGEKTLVGCQDYVPMDQEAEAQRIFDQRVKEAIEAGWIASDGKKARAAAFTVIPPAPVAKKATELAAGPRAAARR